MANKHWFDALDAGAILLTVNQRLARDFTHRFNALQLEAGKTVWATPKIMPWRAWLSAQLDLLATTGQSQSVLMPAVVEQQLWRECIEADKQTRQLLDIHGAARQAMEAWQIAHAWHCQPDTNTFLPTDQAAFVRWSRRFEQRCDSEQRISEAVLPDYLCSLMAEALLGALPSEILLAGFLNLTPQQQDWIEALEQLGCRIKTIEPAHHGQATVSVYQDDDAELLSIAATLRSTLESKPDQRLGVVVPNLHQRRASCMRLFDQQFFPMMSPSQIDAVGRPYDISLGTPLDEQAIVKSALLILQLKLAVLRDADIAEFVLSPYVGDGSLEARDRERLDRQLRQDRIEQVSLKGLIKEIKSSPARLKAALTKVARIDTSRSVSCAEWSVLFGQLLHTSGWPGTGIGSEEYQAVQSWKRCLDDLQLLDNREVLSFRKVMSLLRDLLRDRLFQLETPARPIQIMGRLESHGIEFDQLWVCGMDASLWPAPASASPFLSIAKQKQQAVPQADAKTRLSLAEQEVDLWFASSPLISFSYSHARDGVELIPAPVLNERGIKETTSANAALVSPAALICGSIELDQIADTHGIPVPELEKVRGGARLLENQSDCPFRAYALHRLSIKPLEEAGMGLDARQHGTMLHKALELFWQKIKTSSALHALSNEQLREEISLVTDQALNEMELSQSLRDIEHRRLHRLILEWIEQQEKTRETAFEVIEFESSREIEQNGISVQLMVDRIDRLATGESIVLDYKTGIHNSIRGWAEDRIKSPQLPLYALTDDAIQGVAFAQVARHKHGFVGVAADKFMGGIKASEDWSATVADWRVKLDHIAGEISEGLATITPAKNACQFCEVSPLCRIEKQAGDDVDLDAEKRANS